LVASEDVPSGTVEVSSCVGIVIICAIGLTGVVEVNVRCGFDGSKDFSLVISERINIWHVLLWSGSNIDVLEGFAGSINWPSWLRVKEIGGVWVVGHCHVEETIFEMLVKVLNGLSAVDGRASLEKLVELWPGILLSFEIFEELKSLFDTISASCGVQGAGKIVRCDVREAVLWSSWGSLEIKKRS